jgi:ATP/maltotriose-dependent transcriptional regulator MalT
MSQPYQIRLVINANQEGHTASWIESDGQESEAFALELPITEESASELRWYLETYFQQATDTKNEMLTSDLLAMTEMNRGHLDAAEAWYTRSRELALQSNDDHQFALVAHNLGLLYQTRAEQATDEVAARTYLRQAKELVKESLEGAIKFKDNVRMAASYYQLGEPDEAEMNVQHSVSINESLNLPDVYKDYLQLANIARARGDLEAAERWQAKYEAKLAEVQRLRRGESTIEEDGNNSE